MALAREEILLLWKSDISQVEKSLATLRGTLAQLQGLMPRGPQEGALFAGLPEQISQVQRLAAEYAALKKNLADIRLEQSKTGIAFRRAEVGAREAKQKPTIAKREAEAARQAEKLVALEKEEADLVELMEISREKGAAAELALQQRIVALQERALQLTQQQTAARRQAFVDPATRAPGVTQWARSSRGPRSTSAG